MNKLFLHAMSTKQACTLKVRHFYAKQCCTKCGSLEKYMLNFNPSSCVCVGCYPEPWKEASCGKLNASENKRNKEKAKLKKDNWGLPVVFGGYNTI